MVFRPEDMGRAQPVILTHGFRGSKEGGGKAVEFAQRLRMLGCLVLIFDFSGVGESEGDFSKITLTRQREELRSALDVLSNLTAKPTIVIGRSFGGATALAAAAVDRRIFGLSLWSTPFDLEATFRNILQANFERLQSGETITLMDDKELVFCLRPDFVRDLFNHDLLQIIQQLNECSILIIHGENDQIVAKAQSEQAYFLAREPKRLLILPGADHALVGGHDAAWKATEDWLRQLASI